MALRTTIDINIDFYDKKYILINAKQYDINSRFISATCYNNGEVYPINTGEHSAYIKYKKPDNHSVFNACEITQKGKVLIELTEQMLAVDGICYADLVIVSKGKANVDFNTGEITSIDDGSVLATMTFCIDVSESAIMNAEIESSYEFDALNQALIDANAEYEDVIKAAKSYAHGNTGVRAGENTDNAKYYYQQSLNNKNSTDTNTQKAQTYMNNASASATAASLSEQNAQTYMNGAQTHMESASTSATNARNYANQAVTNMNSAKTYAENAAASASDAISASAQAGASELAAYNYRMQTEAIVGDLNGAFLPMGTITFAELLELKANGALSAGHLYNISDNFTTDANFKKGAGIAYDAGVNVYFTADGFFDVLTGTTVTGIKGDAETDYRKGNVNITAENIGVFIASVDEMKTYIGI